MRKISLVLFLLALLLMSGKSKPIKIFMVGDSTMADKSPVNENPERGWGMVLPSYFNNNVVIENHARNGRSSKTFIAEGRWDFVLNRIGEGDYVIIQFGHNDEVPSKKSYCSEAEFEANFRKMVTDVSRKNANPILCTSIARRKFDSVGNLVDTHPVYPDIIKKVAKEMHIPLIDMELKSEVLLKKYGVEGSKKLFMHIEPGLWKGIPDGKTDDTHLVDAGAMEMAALAIEGIKELKIIPLKKNLVNSKKLVLKYTTPLNEIEK